MSPYPFLGDDLPPRVSNGLVSPGLDQPPPRVGEGERESDISKAGVPGMGRNGRVEPSAVSPDVASKLCFAAAGLLDVGFQGDLTLDDRRRLCDSVAWWAVVDWDASVTSSFLCDGQSAWMATNRPSVFFSYSSMPG